MSFQGLLRFLKLARSKPQRQPQTYDISEWQYDWLRLLDSNGFVISMGGWSHRRPKWEVNDFVVIGLKNENRTTRYRVLALRLYSDPPDMWSATLEFAPRN